MTLNRGPIIRAPAFANLGSRYETRIAQDVHLQDGSGLVIGHTAQINAGGLAEMQVLGTDDGTDSVITIASFNTTGSVQPLINLVKSGAATIGGANVIMADGENLGAINWMGDDGNNLATAGARIQATIDGTPDTNDLPTALKFFTALGAAQDDLAEKMRISPAGDLHISDGGGIVVGHTAQVNVAGAPAELQVLGTGDGVDSGVTVAAFNTTNSVRPTITLLKSGNATVGSNTIVADGEVLGEILWNGADGNNFATVGAKLRAVIDGTPDANDLPTALVFFTALGSSADDLAEKMRISPAGDLHISDGGGIVIGHTAQVNIAGLAELQVLGTSAADSTFSIGNWNTTNSEQPVINMLKSGNATIGSNTIVADGENLGAINWIGDDSNNYATVGARIQATIDGTPDVNDLPTALKFFTALGAAQDDLAEKMRLSPSGDLHISNGGGIIVGHTAQVTGGSAAELQVLGTVEADASALIGRFQANASGSLVQFIKGRGTAIGDVDTVNDNDQVGSLVFFPADGTDLGTLAASFEAEVDDAAGPATGDIGMAFVWNQMNGGGGSAAETWRMTASGQFISGGIVDNPANITADGSVICEGGLAFTDVANAHIDDATQGTGTVTHYIGNNTIDVTAPSDARLKEDFEPFTESVLKQIGELDFQTFQYTPEGLREEYGRAFGLTAQNVESVLPEYVFERTDGYKQIAYNKMVPYLLRAVQELNARLEVVDA